MNNVPAWVILDHIIDFETSFKAKNDPNLLGVKLTKQIRNIQQGTKNYSKSIQKLWEQFLIDPSKENAELFINEFETLTEEEFAKWFPAFLLVDELSKDQKAFMKRQIKFQVDSMKDNLLPDVIKGVIDDRNWESFDARLLVLYPGFLWHSGMLATVLFDGLDIRDLADLFLFAGPKDERTCKGDRGCETYANRIFTVAEILANEIIPGKMNCITNCRHFLLPVASPLTKPQKKELTSSLEAQFGLQSTLDYWR